MSITNIDFSFKLWCISIFQNWNCVLGLPNVDYNDEKNITVQHNDRPNYDNGITSKDEEYVDVVILEGW